MRLLRASAFVVAALFCGEGTARAQDAGADAATDEAIVDAGIAEVAPPLPSPPQVVEGLATSAVARKILAVGAIDEDAKPSFQHEGSLAATSPTLALPGQWTLSLYGILELDFLRDSTMSFGYDAPLAPNNLTLSRPGSILGNTSQSAFSGHRSRLGLSLTGPVTDHIRARLVLQTTSSFQNNDRVQLGHLYVGFETPIIDVLVGRSYSLFGWGGKGFAPTTAAYRSVFGQIYELTPQVRLSHIFRTAPVDFEVAAAAVAPPAGGSRTEWQAGLRLAFNRWRGAAAQGVGPAEVAAAQVGISALGRQLDSGYWADTPPADRDPPTRGGGLALNLLLPIIPASPRRGLRNALTLTLEVSAGTGIADVYPGLDGGALPLLAPLGPDSSQTPSAIYFVPHPWGTVALDRGGRPQTINWRAFVVGAHYHLPIGNGDWVWISAVHARLSSSNLAELTPASFAGIWTHGAYSDATVFGKLTPGFHASLAHQLTTQTFGDGTEARNRRTQVSLYYFF